MPSRFVPADWQLTDHLRDYARDKGFSDRQIDDMEEGFRVCQFPQPILCFDRAWMRWVRKTIEWGKVVPENKKVAYRRPDEATDTPEKVQADWEKQMADLGVSVIKNK